MRVEDKTYIQRLFDKLDDGSIKDLLVMINPDKKLGLSAKEYLQKITDKTIDDDNLLEIEKSGKLVVISARRIIFYGHVLEDVAKEVLEVINEKR